MAVDNGDRMTQASSKPPQRLAVFSITAIFAILIALVFQCMWIVLMALGPGSHLGPTVFYLPPSLLPVFFLVVAFVLLIFHWREVASVETDPHLAEQTPAYSRLHRARRGFVALSRGHKTHTIASSALALIMAGLLTFTCLLLIRNWATQRSSGSSAVVDR
jgi:hypothetical protein